MIREIRDSFILIGCLVAMVFLLQVVVYGKEQNKHNEILKSVEHWGCSAPDYVGPTGKSHAVYQSEWRYWKWLDGRKFWRNEVYD